MYNLYLDFIIFVWENIFVFGFNRMKVLNEGINNDNTTTADRITW